MNWFWIASLPLLGGFIGWSTNMLAVRLLFRPYRPVRIPLVGYRLQGMLPRYRTELAKKVGELIQNELVPLDYLLAYLGSEEMAGELVRLAETAVHARVVDRLPDFLPASLKKRAANLLAGLVRQELPGLISEVAARYGEKVRREPILARLIEERMNEFDLPRLEEIIFQVAGRELRHIEVLGGIIGFFVGIIQAGLMFFLN
ncbi:MAG: DUF445 domain-containing protein [Desulfotomaculales bacterium]